MSIFLIPMAHGHLGVLRELRKLFSEHSAKLRAAESPVPAARRGVSHRGRGRGTRRRGRLALTAATESRKVETIDLVDDGPSVIKKSNSVISTLTDKNNTTTRSLPNDIFNGVQIPKSILVPKVSNALSENSIYSSASSSKMTPLNQRQEPLAVRNKFDNCQFHVSLKNRAISPTNTDKGVFTVPTCVPSASHRFAINGQNTRYETSSVLDSHVRSSVLTNAIGVPITSQSLSTVGQNHNLRHQPLNMIASSVSDLHSPNFVSKNSISAQNTTPNCQTNGQDLRYKHSNMIASSAYDSDFRNRALTNSIGVSNTALDFSSNGQHLQYEPANMTASGVSGSYAQNGAPNTIHSFRNNGQSSRDQTSNMIGSSVSDRYAHHMYQNQPTTSKRALAQNGQYLQYQNPYRLWSQPDGQMQSDQAIGRRSSYTVASPEPQPHMDENFSDHGGSYLQNLKLPTFEEAISTLRPSAVMVGYGNGYSEDHVALGSGFPANEPNEALNRTAIFAGNQLPNHVNTNIQPYGFYQVHQGANGVAYYDSRHQGFHGDNTFAYQGLYQSDPRHQSRSYITDPPNDRAQSIQSNRTAVITNNFKLHTVDKSAEKIDKDDDDYANISSNNPTSSKSVKAFTPDEGRAEQQPAENPVDILKAECFFENASDYDDSNESGLVIDEGEFEEGLRGERSQPGGGDALMFPSMPDISSLDFPTTQHDHGQRLE